MGQPGRKATDQRAQLLNANGADSSLRNSVQLMGFDRMIPILRIFDEAKAKEFYMGFLGFKVDWEHRFEPDLPLYMQSSKDKCVNPLVRTSR